MIVSEPAAIVGGWHAVVLAVALRDYQRRGGFARLPRHERVLLDEAITELEQAGQRWQSGVVTSGHECSVGPTLAAVAQTGDVLLDD